MIEDRDDEDDQEEDEDERDRPIQPEDLTRDDAEGASCPNPDRIFPRKISSRMLNFATDALEKSLQSMSAFSQKQRISIGKTI